MDQMANSYVEMRQAVEDVLLERGRQQHRHEDDATSWPRWLPLVIAVATMIVTITLAYAALDKRISLIEQKLDYIVEKVKVNDRAE